MFFKRSKCSTETLLGKYGSYLWHYLEYRGLRHPSDGPDILQRYVDGMNFVW